jgi:hypothetical protein
MNSKHIIQNRNTAANSKLQNDVKMIRIYIKLIIIFAFFFSSFAYGDTLDYYKIYYNDSLIYESDISHCIIFYSDTNNVHHFKAGEPDVVSFNQIDSNGVFKIEYYRDYGGSADTILFLELQTDSGIILKKYAIPRDRFESKVMIINGSEIISVLRNNRLNSFVFVYYDNEILELESQEIQLSQLWDHKYEHEEDWRWKLLKIIIKKI